MTAPFFGGWIGGYQESFQEGWKKLKTGFEPNSDGNTGKEADDVEESLKENDDDGDTGAHSFLG
ncbi:MAG: hypothetical protein EBS53_08795 [Bacteroidetes bacterium]|nr:hypothetical protein [Bacteroidota bacterium]